MSVRSCRPWRRTRWALTCLDLQARFGSRYRRDPLPLAALAVAKRTSAKLGQGSRWTRWNTAASQPLFAVLLPQIDGSANAVPTRKTITAR